MKKVDAVQEIEGYWQYIMLAIAIFLAIIFCCYYIISQSKWGFYKTEAAGAGEESASDLRAVDSVRTKRAYLTFDDGPSKNTGEILDILDENNVTGMN